MNLPNEFEDLSIIIFDRSYSEKVPKRAAILLVIQQASTEASPGLQCLSNMGHLFFAGLGSLQKPAVAMAINVSWH